MVVPLAKVERRFKKLPPNFHAKGRIRRVSGAREEEKPRNVVIMGSVATPVRFRMPSVNGGTDGVKPNGRNDDATVTKTGAPGKTMKAASGGHSLTDRVEEGDASVKSAVFPDVESIPSELAVRPTEKKGLKNSAMAPEPKDDMPQDDQGIAVETAITNGGGQGILDAKEELRLPLSTKEECEDLRSDCQNQLRKLSQINRRGDNLMQRIHRIQTKSGVEVVYSELKQMVLKGQEIFKVPCLMNKSGQLAAQQAQKDKFPIQRKFNERDNNRLKRDGGLYESMIANSEKLCDSSATESSSDDEEMPEKVEIFNGKRNLSPFRYPIKNASNISRHPRWRWIKCRAHLGAKWTWLQAQVSELEYRIRQQSDLCRQLKSLKQPCLSSSSTTSNHANGANQQPNEGRCARVIPINENFRRRRLIVTQSVAPSVQSISQFDVLGIPCDCGSLFPQVELCVRCSLLHGFSRKERFDQLDGRQQFDETPLSRQLMAGFTAAEVQSNHHRLSQLDGSIHNVLSTTEDVSLNLQYESLLRSGYSSVVSRNAALEGSEIASKKRKDGRPSIDDDSKDTSSTKRKRHSSHAAIRENKLDRKAISKLSELKKRKNERRATFSLGKRSMSVDSQEQMDEEFGVESSERSLPNRPRKTSHVSQENSYDIDNIVIPYGMMSCTRLSERLKYKEILTPKWRVVNVGEAEHAVLDSSKESYEADDDHYSAQELREIEGPDSRSTVEPIEEPKKPILDENDDSVAKNEDLCEESFETRHKKLEKSEKERFYPIPKGKASSKEASQPSTRACISETIPTKEKPRDLPDDVSVSDCDREDSMDPGRARTQNRSLSQDFAAPEMAPPQSPYVTRSFPLSETDFEMMLAENPTSEPEDEIPEKDSPGTNHDPEDDNSKQPPLSALGDSVDNVLKTDDEKSIALNGDGIAEASEPKILKTQLDGDDPLGVENRRMKCWIAVGADKKKDGSFLGPFTEPSWHEALEPETELED